VTTSHKSGAHKRRAMLEATGAEIEQAVVTLLAGAELRSPAMIDRVDDLADRFGKHVFSEILWQLARLAFDDVEAERHWRAVCVLLDELADKLGSRPDLRVALVSYFVDVSRTLQNPAVIELALLRKTEESAYRDELTGLYNYRYLKEHLPIELQRAERKGAPLSVLLFDLDDFKRYNDREGHEAGNGALSAIGRLMPSCLRKSDVAIRYGGEELVVLLPSAPKDKALEIAERIRLKIAETFRAAPTELTVSGGVATYPADGATGEEILRAADRAMYVAKVRGKNRVMLFGDDRRSYRRLPTVLSGTYRSVEGPSHSLVCRDLSEGGMLIGTKEAPSLGVALEVQVEIGAEEPFTAIARVARVSKAGKQNEVGVTYLDMSREHRQMLRRYVREHATS
jgi:diguanylate cyclase (GGDEF)-like protein